MLENYVTKFTGSNQFNDDDFSLFKLPKVCKKTRKVLAQCPVLKTQLSDQLSILEEEAENLLQKGVSVGLNKKQMRVAVQNLNEDIEKIKDTIALADESMRITDEQFKKIKNAMMW